VLSPFVSFTMAINAFSFECCSSCTMASANSVTEPSADNRIPPNAAGDDEPTVSPPGAIGMSARRPEVSSRAYLGWWCTRMSHASSRTLPHSASAESVSSSGGRGRANPW
jgi:hypothetical protein